MHYYQFNIADYRKDTAHLKPIEHYIYRTLIDWYYLDEKPLPKETQVVSRRLGLGKESIEDVENVLSDFFVCGEDGWHHHRVDEEIAEYHSQCTKNKENGKAGGRPSGSKNKPKETQVVSSGNPVVTLTTNQEPLTIKQEPKEKKQRGSRLPTDFLMPDDWFDFCRQERPDLTPDKVFDSFKDFWIAKAGAGGVKLDWLATWRNWVRNQKAPQALQLTFAQRDEADKKKRYLERTGRHWDDSGETRTIDATSFSFLEIEQ